jgi:NAD(P)-dependent dehydrogenase (short-subunit alcohol dehydrogenase family)
MSPRRDLANFDVDHPALAVARAAGMHDDPAERRIARKSGELDAAFFKADVRREAEVSALVDQVVARFGRLDIAVNNAGKEAFGLIPDVTLC